MATVTIRGLEETALERLRARAIRHHRSLEGELRMVLLELAEVERWYVEPGDGQKLVIGRDGMIVGRHGRA